MTTSWVRYRLTGNKNTACPTGILYFDVETDYIENKQDQVHSFRLAVTCFQRYKRGLPQGKPIWKEHLNPDDTFNYITARARSHSSLWVIAHNMEFDFAGINGYANLTKGNWTVRFWAIGAKHFILRIKHKRASIQWVDSMGFISGSIKQLGKKVGLEKLPMPSVKTPDEDWFAYCRRDVEVMKQGMEVFIRFIKEHDLGKFSLTIAGQALQAYRHHFLLGTIQIHRYPHVMEAERKAYHGGRTEAFYIGKVPVDKVYYLDVNSMYPSVMLRQNYPVRYHTQVLNPSLSRVAQASRDFEVMVKGQWNIPEPVLPVLDERLTFPIGRISSVITGPEYRYLADRGWITSIDKLWVYKRGQPFNDYINYFWNLRKEAIASEDKVWDWISKLFMNSLYGKFGQRNPIYEVLDAHPGQPDGLEAVITSLSSRPTSRMILGGKIWLKTGEEPAQWTFYPLSAWVTAYARLKLWDLIKLAGKGHCYYCDTDSLYVDQVGFDNLQHLIAENQLGKLGIKRQGRSLIIKGAKDYEFDGKRYLKGVPEKAIEIEPGVFKYWTFLKTRTKLRTGDPNQIIQKTITKKLSRKYKKGEILSTGEVIPYELR